MNDPNGMVYAGGRYHLFFQYHPGSSVWGPMHWGHASSADLVHWEEHDVALAPDGLGMIFSGSAVVDWERRSGLGPEGSQPLVALFTHHDMQAEHASGHGGSISHEVQSLAFSLDDGATWTHYAHNPVLPNPGRKDFRDPKLRWWPERERWIMCLACGDHIRFYSSPNLTDWAWESSFGHGLGAQGGVWECPDLFPLRDEHGVARWVLLVSLNPGGPNSGSATQYFVGDFDGRCFTPEHTDVRWLDFGPDNYAGVTWSGVEDRALFLGWMSNWAYATTLPTAPWRSAMTLPRELSLRAVEGRFLVASKPARELEALQQAPSLAMAELQVHQRMDLSAGLAEAQPCFVIHLDTPALSTFTLSLANEADDALHIGYNAHTQRWWIDRRQAGDVSFHPAFAGEHSAPRLSTERGADLSLWFDACSVELFADGGLSCLSSLHFAHAPWRSLTLSAAQGLACRRFEVCPLGHP